jgi:carotenoid cleavage dioxygenase-like enzyme
MTGHFDIGFTTLSQEIVCDALPVRGTLPSWLSGTLLRTGPAQFEVGQEHYRHWFDGLAMLHRFSFHAGAVSYANRFLQSKTYQANREAGTITYGEFATDPCRSLFKRLATTFTREVSDNANVSISKLGEDFVALTEVPLPVMFDPQTLETLGVFAFDDGKSSYNVYAITEGDRQRRLLGTIPTEEPAYIHSFGMTEHYVVLAEYPLVVNPLSMLLSGKPFIENYHWKPERGTYFLVLDKRDGSLVGRYESEPFSEESFDLPRINYAQSNGRDYRFAYGASRRKETPDDFQNQLVKVDVHTRETQRWFEEDCYPGEAIFVAAPDATREDEGVLLSVVLDGKKGTSFLLVLDAPSFRELARASVPHHIPFSFHGMYSAS